MALVATYSKHKTGNLKIFIIVLLAAAAWFAYDGYFNKEFIEEHSVEKKGLNDQPMVDENGNPVLEPDSTLGFNQKFPPYAVAGAVILAIIFLIVKDKKLVLEDGKLIEGEKIIKIDAIEKIDKTYFDKKGVFTISYKNESGSEVNATFSDRKYDNLKPIVDEIVANLSD